MGAVKMHYEKSSLSLFHIICAGNVFLQVDYVTFNSQCGIFVHPKLCSFKCFLTRKVENEAQV